jgi:23S rRNA (uracil1939-C5)-methyltransferase
LVLTIDRLDHDGAGVADVQTDVGLFRVHVAGALPGEQVCARVAHVSPHAREQGQDAWADLEEIVIATPERVAPPCPAPDGCGSCPLARWAYAAQVEWKRGLVAEVMATQKDLLVADCVPSPRPFGYRGNAKYVFGHDHDGKLVLGAYAPRSHEIVDMSGCPIGEPALSGVAAALLPLLVQHAVEPFDEVRRTGLLRYVVSRANAEGKVLVALVTGHENWPEAEPIARELAAACPAVLGIVHNINNTSGNALFGESERLIFGSAFIEDSIGPARVRLGPRSFAQANRLVAGRTYHDIVAAAARLGSIDRAVDAYAGAGGIALSLAPLAREVVAIEENPAACATARAFLAERGSGDPGARVRFVTGDVADHLAQVGTADVVVLNPPRKGCAPAVLEAVAQLRPRMVAYLSCNPTTLARDLAALARLGLRTVSITPYDMLPHTPHVEALALLERG